MKFQLLIKAKMWEKKTLLALKLSEVVFIMLINVEMPTIVGILSFNAVMSMIKSMLSSSNFAILVKEKRLYCRHPYKSS